MILERCRCSFATVRLYSRLGYRTRVAVGVEKLRLRIDGCRNQFSQACTICSPGILSVMAMFSPIDRLNSDVHNSQSARRSRPALYTMFNKKKKTWN
jgi:hypothetical protein